MLILDETTSALDAMTETNVVNGIIGYCKSRGILLIFIAHRQTVIDSVDEVITMKPVSPHNAKQGNKQISETTD